MADKNMADVADKAVDKIAGGVEAAAKAFEKVAPQAWDIMVHQKRIEGIVNAATAAVFIVAALVGFLIVWRKSSRFDDEEAMVFARGASGVVLVMTLIIGGTDVMRNGILQAANPEYYAAKELLEAVK